VVPFERLCAVSYSPSIVTMAVCEISSVEEWCDLENRVRIRSKSLEMSPFDRSHTYEILLALHSGAILYCLPDIVTPSEFSEGV